MPCHFRTACPGPWPGAEPRSRAHAQVQEPLRKCRTLHGELAALQGVMAGTLSTPAFNASAAGQLDDAARRLERRERRVIALLESCAAEVRSSCCIHRCAQH